MGKKYRALGLVSLFYKIVAWIMLIGGVLFSVVVVVLGAVVGRAGIVSPVLEPLPVINDLSSLWAGLAAGIVLLIGALIGFVLLMATSEIIQLGLAIERNTRETATYLRGESTLPPPPAPARWETKGATVTEA